MIRSLVAVGCAILGLLGWCISLEFPRLTGTVIRARVQGHDPRDILAGHYISFRLDFKGNVPCSNDRAGGEACVCYQPEPSSSFYETFWAGECSNRPEQCDLFLRGTCQYGRFQTNADRYFIPDYYSLVLQTAPTGSSVDLALSRSGSGRVLGFYVGDETVEAYAARKLSSPR